MISALAPFLAGLGLFFTGVHFISTNLTPLVGRRFRTLLGRMSSNIWVTALSGIAAGIVTQSSNAVTSVAVGLVNANAINLRKAILIATWSHVGTSALVILVAVDFRIAASYVVALAGVGIYFGFSRNDQSRNAINILLGAGLLFFGMGMLKSGTEPLREVLIRDGVVAFITGAVWLSLLCGALTSLLCQSSSVAGAIAVAATNIGVIDFSGACWLIYGANLGSALNQYLLASAHQGELRQISMMQVTQKCAAFGAVLVATAIGTGLGIPLIERGATAAADTAAGQVAWVFLVYQLVGSLTCTLAFAPLMQIVRRVAPQSPLQEMSKPLFLLDDALVEPSLALELATREEGRLIERLPMMLDDMRADAVASNGPPDVLRAASHSIGNAMTNYLASILQANLDRRDRGHVIRLQHRTANLVALFDALNEFTNTARELEQWPSSAPIAENMVEALHALLSALVDATKSEDPAEREFVLSLLGHRDELMEKMRQRVLRENPDLPAKAQESLFAATMLFEPIVWLARRGTLLLAPDGDAMAEQAA